ncbi:MAG TPA: vitamin K epoxide reductase family protein [Spirillospora sp.]
MTQDTTAKGEAGADGRAGTAAAPLAPAWFLIPAWILTVAGLGISGYLTVTHYNEDALVCSASRTVDCHAVTTSDYSTLLGIPMPLLGLAFFAGFGALLTPWALRSRRAPLRWGRLVSTVVGVLFVVYLVTVELALLHKICLWCTGVHVITVLLFVLVLADEFRRVGQVD